MRGCARSHRPAKQGPLPVAERTLVAITASDRRLFVRAIQRAKPPAGAVGFKLYCAELGISLPAAGSRRFDGSFPRHDYFTLHPLEIPRVPLATNYQIVWVFPSGDVVPSNPPYFVHIVFPSDMRQTDEVGRRLKAWYAEQAKKTEPQLAEQAPESPMDDGEEADEKASADVDDADD
jgi:hypothetical protein